MHLAIILSRKLKKIFKRNIFIHNKKNIYIFAVAFAMVGCASVNTQKTPAQISDEKADSEAFTLLTGGLPQEPTVCDTVEIGSGMLYKVAKTDSGKILRSISTDDGKTWGEPTAIKYFDSDRAILNPNSRPQIFKLTNGAFILLYYNNTSNSYNGGNVIWASGGRLVGDDIRWSQPEVLLVSKDSGKKYSLPIFIEKNGSYLLFTRSGNRGVLNRVDARKVKSLISEPERTLATISLILNLRDIKNGGTTVSLPRIPEIKKNGLTVEFIANMKDITSGITIFDNTDAQGKGLRIATAAGMAFAVTLNDGVSQISWTTDTGAFSFGKDAHIAIVVNGKDKLIMSIVDGQIGDGDSVRSFGWETFYPEIASINASGRGVIGRGLNVELKRFRLYSRALGVGEIISNRNSGR